MTISGAKSPNGQTSSGSTRRRVAFTALRRCVQEIDVIVARTHAGRSTSHGSRRTYDRERRDRVAGTERGIEGAKRGRLLAPALARWTPCGS
jgi:hypothetical protein